MSQHSADILQEVFCVPIDKIDLIPHGIPDLPFTDPSFYKDAFGTEGKDVLLTFGLLSPNKGIENVIQALPKMLSRHKTVIYMVAGATHPHILRHEGDKYRAYLQKLCVDLGVEANVVLRNRFLTPEEMVELIDAADIYITPYKHKAQVVWIRNCLSYERQWQEAEGSEDSHGRAVWALGTVRQGACLS